MSFSLKAVAAFFVLFLVAGCGMSQEEARQKLEDSGVEYTKESFFEQVNNANVENVELFLTAGMDPNSKVSSGPSKGTTALVAALSTRDSMSMNRENTISALLQADADASALPANLLPVANPEMVRTLLEAGVDAKGDEGKQALFAAAGNNHGETVKLLIESGVDSNARYSGRGRYDGQTPLLLAAFKGCDRSVEALLTAGADPNQRGSEGMDPGGAETTPLLMATYHQNEDVATYRQKGDGDNFTNCGNYPTTVKALAEGGADLEARQRSGMTALLMASKNGLPAVVRELLVAGADRSATNDFNDRTALEKLNRSMPRTRSQMREATGEEKQMLREVLRTDEETAQVFRETKERQQ